MISFVCITYNAITKNRKFIPAKTFKFIKYNIILSDIIFDLIVTGITLYLVYELDFATWTGLIMLYFSTIVNVVVSYSEIMSTIQLEKYTLE